MIPDKVFIEGTLRTMNESWRQTALHKIQQIAYSIASGMGGKCSINIINGYPPLINNDEITRKAISFTNEILGDENVEQAETWMASEDFAYFAQKYPSVFYRLGIQGEHNTYSFPLHNTSFDLDENALKTGLETMCYLIVKFLME